MTFFTDTFATGDTIDADSRAARECDPADLTRLFALMAASITYDNFKSAIASHSTQNDKQDAYHDIHRRMAQWQARPS
jgi:hypothetical protein